MKSDNLKKYKKVKSKRKTIVSSISLDVESYSFIKANNIDLSRFVRDCIRSLIKQQGEKSEKI